MPAGFPTPAVTGSLPTMSGRYRSALVGALIFVAALVVAGPANTTAQAAPMCPPVTLDDLFPEPAKSPPPPTSVPAPTTTTPDTTATTTYTSTTATTQPPTETTVTTAPPGTGTSAPVPAPSPSPRCEPFRYDMLWPLAGQGQVVSGFGADRDHGARRHQGVDLSAPKLTPVVAVADGVVMKVVQEVGTEECCWMSLRHNDGWQSYYVHLNNDTHGSDDGMGFGVRPDLEEGVEVTAGEVVGWVGDSGNAEETIDHLHFELRNRAGIAVDAGPSVRAAQQIADTPAPETTWPYADDDGIEGEWLAATLVSQGLFLPCDETMIMFCPGKVASPEFVGEIAAHFAAHAPPPIEGRYQSVPTSLNPTLLRPRTLELALGCDPIGECLDYGLPETSLARLAAWVHIETMVSDLLPDISGPDDELPSINLPSAADAETRLRAEGAIEACNPPLDANRLLTRQETMIRLVSWIRGLNPEPCSEGPQRIR